MTKSESLASLEETMKRQEPLHEDLQLYLNAGREGGLFGECECLKHPLVFGVPYFEHMNAFYNQQYVHKKAYVEEKLTAGNYAGALFMYERPYRIDKLLEWVDEIEDDKVFWGLVGDCWIDTENMWQYEDEAISLLECGRPHREFIMDEEERSFMDSLPDKIAVYRGHQQHNRTGFSWTLNYWRARWFAKRFAHKGKGWVARGIVDKNDIYGVLLGRGEYEIIIVPDFCEDRFTFKNIRDIKRPDWIKNVKALAMKEFKLSHNSHHGWWHWQQVERHALKLAKEVPGADITVCQLFALIHDCKRENENDDPKHGHRAADFASQLKSCGALKINDAQLNLLIKACKLHNDGQISNDPTIGACWDADRLDLPRVKITPDPNLLSTEAGKQLMWSI